MLDLLRLIYLDGLLFGHWSTYLAMILFNTVLAGFLILGTVALVDRYCRARRYRRARQGRGS